MIDFLELIEYIKTLEKYNLLDTYINNFNLCKEKGFNIIPVEVAYPPILDEVEKYKKYFQERGINLIFCPFIGKYNGKTYPASYTPKELNIFNLNKNWLVTSYQKGKLFNAGYNASVVYPNGTAIYCASINKKIGNVYTKIKFNDKLIRCPFEICLCPLNEIDLYLFKKAIKETKLNNTINPIFLIKNVLKNYLKREHNKFLIFQLQKGINHFFRKNSLLIPFFTKLFPSLNHSKVIRKF